MSTEPTTNPAAPWPEALATVLSCTYDFGAGRALIGIPTDKHFRISYNYFANDELHTGEFNSAKALPQGTLFSIRYNPAAPHQHSHDAASAPRDSRASLLTFGILGSVVLSLAWLAILHGCR